MLTGIRKGIFDELFLVEGSELIPIDPNALSSGANLSGEVTALQADVSAAEARLDQHDTDLNGKQDSITTVAPLGLAGAQLTLDTANLGDITTNIVNAQLINCAFDITCGEIHALQLRGNALASLLTTVDNKILPVSNRVTELESIFPRIFR